MFGQIWIGGVVWGNYLILVWALTSRGVDHTIAELAIIPLSWVANYFLNSRHNFHVQMTFRRGFLFVGVSLLAWIPFILCSYFLPLMFGLPIFWAQIVGIASKTGFNVSLQQLLTFKGSPHAHD